MKTTPIKNKKIKPNNAWSCCQDWFSYHMHLCKNKKSGTKESCGPLKALSRINPTGLQSFQECFTLKYIFKQIRRGLEGEQTGVRSKYIHIYAQRFGQQHTQCLNRNSESISGVHQLISHIYIHVWKHAHGYNYHIYKITYKPLYWITEVMYAFTEVFRLHTPLENTGCLV